MATAACPAPPPVSFEDWSAPTDEQLIAAYRDGWESVREQAIEELFRRHHARVTGWCWRFTRDREAARDLSQEIFMRAFRKLEAYRGECRFSTWLYVIAQNLCRSALHKRASEPVWTAKAITADLPDPTALDIQARMERAQTRDRGWRMILDTLDQTEAKVLTLHYGHELPLDAVSRMLGLTNKSGAKAYIVSAKRKLNAARIREAKSKTAAPENDRPLPLQVCKLPVKNASRSV